MSVPFGQIWGQRRDHAVEGMPPRGCRTDAVWHRKAVTKLTASLRHAHAINGMVAAKKSIPFDAASDFLVPWTCRGHAADVPWRCRGDNFHILVQPYRGDTVEGVVDLCDPGISE